MGALKSPVVGTELKINVGLTVGGKNWGELENNNPFELQFYTGSGGTVTVTGSAPSDIHDGIFMAKVDTAATGPGTISMKVILDVYDDDMSDEDSADESRGYRREVAVYNTGIKVYE